MALAGCCYQIVHKGTSLAKANGRLVAMIAKGAIFHWVVRIWEKHSDQVSRLDAAGNPGVKQGWIQPT
jgi:hypothetical protein